MKSSSGPTSVVDIPRVLARDVGFLLARCSAIGVRATNAALASVGLRVRHYVVLQVAAGPGGASQRQLGLDLGLDPSAVVVLVDDLQKAGLVARTADPTDRRVRLVSVTDRGIAVLRTAAPVVAQAMSDVTGSLDENEVETLRCLLQRIAVAADDEPPSNRNSTNGNSRRASRR